MGNCIRQPICGDVSEPAVTTTQSQLQPQPSSSTSSSTTTSLNRNSTRFRGFLSTLNRTAIGRLLTNVSAVNRPLLVSKNNQKIRRLVLSTLKEVRTLLDNSHEPPRAILSLHVLAESEVGWLQVLQVLISTVPLSEPLGPAVILLLLEDWSLPSNESMIGLTDHILELSATFPLESSRSDCACAHLIDDLCVHQIVCTRLRNACVVLACLADKLAGPSSLQLLCQKLLQLLLSMLSIRVDPQLSLFALIALEKFAQTGENKNKIQKEIQKQPNCLTEFNVWEDNPDLTKQQACFCARWALDNVFVLQNSENKSEDQLLNNALLLAPDAGSYVKLSPSGLTARCDAGSFESVRCSFKMTSGVWYYECELLTGGVMQIGVAGTKSRFLSDEGCGVGDDRFSIAYDGCRQLLWYDARPCPITSKVWRPGDVIGCLIDFDAKVITFYLNSQLVASSKDVFVCVPDGLYAAASLMSFQQCRFNFGATPFKHPLQDRQFETFEKNGQLLEEQKQLFVRQRNQRLKLKDLQMPSLVKEDACPLCCDSTGNVLLLPCEHGGFCDTCAAQLEFCPLCRGPINGWK